MDKYEGVYTVTVQGAKDWYGNNADLTYQVEFFDANSGSLSDEKPNDQPGSNPGNQPQQQAISDFVTRLYKTCLNRTPDSAAVRRTAPACPPGSRLWRAEQPVRKSLTDLP